MALSIDQVLAYESMQVELAQMWGDIDMGVIPEPISSLPGNLSVIPTDILDNTVITSSTSSSRSLLEGDVSGLMIEFEDYLSQGSGKPTKKAKKKSNTRDKDVPFITEEETSVLSSVVEPYLIMKRLNKKMTTISISYDKDDIEKNKLNEYYKDMSLFVDNMIIKEEKSSQGSEGSEGEGGGGDKSKLAELKKVEVNVCYKLLYEFIKWREGKLFEADIQRIKAKHEVKGLHCVCVLCLIHVFVKFI